MARDIGDMELSLILRKPVPGRHHQIYRRLGAHDREPRAKRVRQEFVVVVEERVIVGVDQVSTNADCATGERGRADMVHQNAAPSCELGGEARQVAGQDNDGPGDHPFLIQNAVNRPLQRVPALALSRGPYDDVHCLIHVGRSATVLP